MRILSAALAALLSITLVVSCNNREKVKAKIFERKHLPQNKLQIKYQYTAEGKQYDDSVTIENKVLDSDTITVSISTKEPSENTPEL